MRLTLEGTNLEKMNATLSRVTSPSLADIVNEFNDNSINLYGEALVKTIGLEKGKEGSTEEGLRLIREFCAGKGVDSNRMVMRSEEQTSELQSLMSISYAVLSLKKKPQIST